jgi:formylglycine-generating enzyme required for sulfatase activity
MHRSPRPEWAAAIIIACGLAACEATSPLTPPLCNAAGQTWESPIDGGVLVCVPAGAFLMGAAETDPQAKDVERPQHTVTLDAFWIDRTEVTNAQYERCVQAGACERSHTPGATGVASRRRLDYFVNAAYADYPALAYQSFEAADYCAWAGRRLPTEAEWEKAARGTDGRLYPWGDEAPDCSTANGGDCFDDTTAVGSLPGGASPYGAVDMAGNVWEWVADAFDPDYYAASPETNPSGPDSDAHNVRRGGGWSSFERDLRVTRRADGAPRHFFDGQMGFRCAADSP